MEILMNPKAPSNIEEYFLLTGWSLLLSFPTWLTISFLFSKFKDFMNSKEKSVWTAKTLILLSYVEGAIITAFLWTLFLSYSFYFGKFDGGVIAFLPHWIGIVSMLFVASLLILTIRKKVMKIQRKVTEISRSV